jgi:predicted dehydrogenase/nucleoside-diphosphate-sugar epimerase
VGTGYIADTHLEILRRLPGVEIVAVCDTSRQRAERAARRFGVLRALDSLEDLPGAGVELVHLCTPPDTHARLARELLEAGISVFVEKPLALSWAEAAELGQLSAERRLRLAVNHNNLFHPAFVRLRARLESGAIGRLEHVRATLCVPLRQLDAGDHAHWMFREPRNIVFEQATHPLSQIHALAGAMQRLDASVLATRELAPGQLFCERWGAAGRGERASVELHMAFGRSFPRWVLEVIGSDGALEADLHHDLLCGETKTQALDAWNSFLAGFGRGLALQRDALRVFFAWSAQTLKIRSRHDAFFVGMRDSIQAFHAAYRSGGAYPGDVQRATEVLEWCDALAARAPAGEPASEIPAPVAVRPGEVVVTGATGFLGRRVVARLLARGVPVTALVRRTHSLPAVLREAAIAGRLRLVVGGLGDPAAMRELLRGARACIHLATGGGASWEDVEREMVGGSLRLAQAARAEGISRFVYVSSIAALYTAAGSTPAPVRDTHPTDPEPRGRSLYARGKIAAESALTELHAREPIGLVIARPGVVLGPGSAMQHSGLGLWVRDNHCVGWGVGEHALPIVLADDVAEALVLAALHTGRELDGKAMNLAVRSSLSARALVESLARASGRRIVFHPRPIWISHLAEIGKWVVKKIGRRADAAMPSARDFRARALEVPFACETAREVLGWKPREDAAEILAVLEEAHAAR